VTAAERPVDEADRRNRAAQQFWSVVVGAPAIISVLRLVVEAGGELQTTLLLAANVNPVNLVAAFVSTASRVVSGAMVALFAISAVLTVSVDNDQRRWARRGPPLLVRWMRVVPVWFLIVTLLVALVTWKILYLPLLLPAIAATAQLLTRTVDERRTAGEPPGGRRPARLTLFALLLLGYYGLLAPTLVEAATTGEWFVVLILAVPPLLALVVTGPVLPGTVHLLVASGQLTVMIALAWTSYSVATAPVLPSTVTTVEVPGGETEHIRGSVIAVDDASVAILQEQGGVRYVPTDDVDAQVLCPSEADLPRYRLWVHGFHVEDSLLQALGREVRPVTPVDAVCRATASVR